MNGKKIIQIMLSVMLVLLSVLPAPLAQAAGISTETLGDVPAVWPAAFSPYKMADGSGIYDPASDVHPDDVDITSGVGRDTGKLSSMYVASDGKNFFVRLRVKGDPYDRKGGFLSSVWLVQLGVGGEQKATIGLNGKSPHTDYVYVANENGTDVQPIYQTTSDGNKVEGTRIVPAENGQYFIDFQVPIQRITEIAPEIKADTAVQYFFGTSKAANLSVINKEWMNTGINSSESVDFNGLPDLKLTEQPLSIEINGGTSKEYSNTNNVINGTTSMKAGTVSISINNAEKVSAAVSDYKWSYTLPAGITSLNGIYKASVSVTDGSQTANAAQDVMVIGNTAKDSITIDGGAAAVTGSATPALSGSYVAVTNGQNFKILVSVSESSNVDGTWVQANSASNGVWKLNAVSPALTNGKTYYIKAKMVSSNGSITYTIADQQLTYQAGTTITPITTGISTITGSGSPFPAITGTASGAETVEVRIDGTTVEFVKPSNGTWSVEALEKPLSSGTHTITAVATNAAGSSSTATQTYIVSITSITIDNGAAVTINDSHPAIRGNTNAANGSAITVTLGDDSFNTTAQNGRWAIEVPDSTTIPDGTYAVQANVASASAAQQLTIDTATSVDITAPADGASLSESPAFISGNAEPGATINFILKSGSNMVAIETLKAGSNGDWQYIPSSPLPKDTYTVEATASDLYGNEAADTSTFSIVAPLLNIESADPSSTLVDYGTDVNEAAAKLGSQIGVTLSDGTTQNVDVTWSSNDNSYNGKTAGDYTFTGTLKLPEGVNNIQNVKAVGTVTVQPAPKSSEANLLQYSIKGKEAAIDEEKRTVQIELPFDTDVSELISVFTLSEGASASVDSIGQASGTTINDFSSPVVYTVMAEDGTKAEWTVTITKTAQDQTAQPVITTSPVREGDTSLSGASEPNARIVLILSGSSEKLDTTADSNGKWTFTGLALTENQSITVTAMVTGKAESKPAVSTVEPKPSISVESATPITKDVANGTSLTDAKAALGTQAEITLKNGEKQAISVTWGVEANPVYNGTKVGEYVFTGTLGELPDYVINDQNIQVDGIVKVLPAFVQSAQPVEKDVAYGTSLDEAVTALGTQAEVTLANGEKKIVSVTWSNNSVPAYNSKKAGSYVFTGTLGELPDYAVNDQNITVTGTVTVKPALIKEALPIKVKVANGTSIADAKTALGSKAEVTLENGDKITLDVVWNENANPAYDGMEAGEYVFTGSLEPLPQSVINTNDVQISGTVEVLAVPSISIEFAPALKKTVVKGTDFDKVKEFLGDSLIVTLAGGATVKVPVTWTTDDYDGSRTGSYTAVGTFHDYPIGVDNKNNIKAAAAIEVVEPLELSGSMDGVKTVTVAQAVPEAEVHLYNKEGDVVQSKNADSGGNVSFKDVSPGADYYATQTVKESETTPSETVNVYPKITVRYSEGDIWESVTKPVYVMENVLGTTLKWQSSDPEVLTVSAEPASTSPSGTPEYMVTVNRPLKDTSVILTASMLFEGKQIERTFLLVVKAKDYHTEKETKSSDNEVKMGGQPITKGITVTRTTLDNAQWTQLVDKLIINETAELGNGDVSLDFNNRSSNGIRADEQAVEMSLNALRNVAGNLTVSTPEGTFHLPKASIEKMTDAGLDLYFRIVPIRSAADQQEVLQRTKASMQKAAGADKTIKVLDIPREIETNYKGINTDITFPLTNIQLTENQLANLRLLIEHTDGTEEIIVPGSNGEIVREGGKAAGLKFSITHFSTFTFFQIANAPSSPSAPAPVEPEVFPDISIDTPANGQFIVDTVPAVKGTTKANQEVSVYLDGSLLGTVTADAQGKWAYKLPVGLMEGNHTIYAAVKGSKGTERKSNTVTFAFAKSKHHLHYIIGFKDGEFKPTLAVTRAQMAAMLSRNLTGNQVPAAVKNSYIDTETSWARNDIEYAGSVSIMQGFTNNTFKPGQAITRAQMAAIAVRWIDRQCAKDPKNAPHCSLNINSITYKDVPKNHWAAEAIKRISQTGMMEGFGDGTFHPEEPLTRAQAVKVLNRLFQRGPLEGVASPTFKDAPTDHWAFKEVEEAATDHWYVMKDGQETFYKK